MVVLAMVCGLYPPSPSLTVCVCARAMVVARLRVLHFFNNMSGNDGAKAVARIVCASPLLEDLRFASTRGGHDGGMALAEALCTVSTLRRLDLSDNTFSEAVGVVLGRALSTQRHLEIVNLADASACRARGCHASACVRVAACMLAAWM
jgi:Ran GTPase-activating protein 1